ncbi:MAG: VanZ family protein [Phycisphaerales bacterium]|nr:MAG: VanZ family protein [Phycisphaerales bacterium]
MFNPETASRKVVHGHSTEAATARGVSWYWFLAVAAAVLYGSLIPFDLDLGGVVRSLNGGLPQFGLHIPDANDLLTNLLVYIPLGAAFVICGRHSLRVRLARVPFAILLGVGVSVIAETMQVGIASRISSLTDVILNGAGTAMGALLGAGLCDVAAVIFGRLRRQWVSRPFVTSAFILTLGLFVYNLAPFDFITNTAGLQESFRRAQWSLSIARMRAFGELPLGELAAELSGAFWFIGLAYVSALAWREVGRERAKAIALASEKSLILIVVIELMQLFTRSHGFDMVTIALRALGVILGARLAVGGVDAGTRSDWRQRPGMAAPTRLLLVLVAMQTGIMLLSAGDGLIAAGASPDLSRVRWIPFEAMWRLPTVQAASILFSNLLTYGTFAVAMFMLVRRTHWPRGGFIACVGVTLFALAVEGLQIMGTSHTPDLTVPMLALVTSVITAKLYMALRSVYYAAQPARVTA